MVMPRIPLWRIKVILKWDPTIVMYLVIIDKWIKTKIDVEKFRPNAKFFAMVQKYVNGYITAKTQPPPAISSAIMNIADGIMSGSGAAIRAGDYIDLVNFARKQRIM